jgi:hypothetical protein
MAHVGEIANSCGRRAGGSRGDLVGGLLRPLDQDSFLERDSDADERDQVRAVE